MNDPTNKAEAVAAIDQSLREDGIHYEFDDLRDRFSDGYDDAMHDRDDFVTIKIPSSSEYNVPTKWVRLALGYAADTISIAID